jgi:outer membrane lipoprotein-sorting protein
MKNTWGSFGKSLIVYCVLAMGAAGVWAGAAVAAALPTGDEIARSINARDEGRSSAQTLVIETTDSRGNSRVRETRIFRKYIGEEKRTAIFFENPRNVKGTAFLTIDYPEVGRDDDLWLYLPAAQKIRRISMANRGDYFLGTDFTYEDMKKATKVGVEDYKWKTVSEEVVDGRRCFVVEAVPVNEKVSKELGYGRSLQWIDAEIRIFRKIQVWDVQGNELKTIVSKDIRKVQGIWTVHGIEARNHKTGHKSLFTFSNVDYSSELKDDLFTPQALRHAP